MAKENIEDQEQDQELNQTEEQVVEEAVAPEQEVEEAPELVDSEESTQAAMESQLTEARDKYLRLYSEFENFRRRTAKEKIEMVSSASKDLMEQLIPVLDDFERAIKAMENNEETAPAREGTELIYNKFSKVLISKGLKKMEVNKGDNFNDELHEAITQIPAGDDMAGKIVDVVENGYFLGEKVVRFAKVITGAKA